MGKKYKRKYYNKPSPKKRRFFRKAASCLARKNNCKCWTYEEVGRYANECKTKENNKLIEILGRLDYFEVSKEQALDLAPKTTRELLKL